MPRYTPQDGFPLLPPAPAHRSLSHLPLARILLRFFSLLLYPLVSLSGLDRCQVVSILLSVSSFQRAEVRWASIRPKVNLGHGTPILRRVARWPEYRVITTPSFRARLRVALGGACRAPLLVEIRQRGTSPPPRYMRVNVSRLPPRHRRRTPACTRRGAPS